MGLRLPNLGGVAKGLGGVAAGVLGALGGGLLGGLMGSGAKPAAAGSTGSTSSPSTFSRPIAASTPSGGTGKANYNPLPNFSVPVQNAKKYAKATVTDISHQLSSLLSRVLVIDSTLKAQLNLDRFQYKENARLQREANAESKNKLSNTSSLGGFDFSGLIAAIQNLTSAADDASGGFPAVVTPPGREKAPKVGAKTPKEKAAGKKKFKDSQFVKKSDALKKNGQVRSGFEPVTNKAGKVVGYRKSASSLLGKIGGFLGGTSGRRIASDVASGVTSVGKSAAAGFKSNALKIGGKLLTPALVAWQCWDAWKEIQALPPNMKPSEKKNKITKIVSKLVANIGLVWAGAGLGALVGSSIVPGPGTLAGFLGGIVGGIGADYLLGDSVNSIVEKIVDEVVPAEDEPGKAKSTPAKKAKPKQTPAKTITKPSLSRGQKNSDTVGEVVNKTASKIGVDSNVLLSLSKELNPSVNFEADSSKVTGSQVMSLTPEQWSQVSTRYKNSYPALGKGANNVEAAVIGAALLTKDAKAFLDANGIEATQERLLASFMVGNDGIQDLLEADSNTTVDQVVPQAVYKRPEVFSDSSGKPLTVGDFMKNMYDVTIAEKNVHQAPRSTPPSVDTGQQLAQNETKPSTPLYGTAKPTNAAWDSQPPSQASSDTPDGTPMGNEKPSSESMEDAPKDAKPVATPKLASEDNKAPVSTPATTGPEAVSLQPNSENVGSVIQNGSEEVDNMENSPSVSMASTGSTTQSSPAILPSSKPGYTGTGNVPDPNFNLGYIAATLFFKAAPLEEGLWV